MINDNSETVLVRSLRLLEQDAHATGVDLELSSELVEVDEVPIYRICVNISARRTAMFSFNLDKELNETLSNLATEIQEVIIDEIHGAWPECIQHRLPMWLVHGDPPTWECEREPSDSIVVGTISDSTGIVTRR